MKPKVTSITLAVNNLEKSVAFYRDGLGFPTEGIIRTSDDPNDTEHIALFKLEGGLVLSLYPRNNLATDTGLPIIAPNSLEFMLMHQVETKEEVDAVMKQAEAAGGRIVDPARDIGDGVYSGFFQDVDGHIWEIVSSPK